MININSFMNTGIKNIMDTAGRFYLGNRRGQIFLLKTASALHSGAKKREKQEQNGIHIPPFLIASISSNCNLHCAGCYARANGGCSSQEAKEDMSLEDWRRIFTEASELGISFILLAGGEPMMRRDIIDLAAKEETIIFPIFTNGTLMDGAALTIFDEHRHLIPVLSVEGDEIQTDRRRGPGVAQIVHNAIDSLKEKEILFGVSITVTTENMETVTDSAFVQELGESGCGLVFYVEYVPAEKNTEHLILDQAALALLQIRLEALRDDRKNRGMIFLSFPGDEEKMGGCLAAGRGFFHVNAEGGAEPCPFSPHWELNLKSHTILDILQSPFMEKVRQISAEEALNHHGGCTLFQYEKEVKKALL